MLSCYSLVLSLLWGSVVESFIASTPCRTYATSSRSSSTRNGRVSDLDQWITWSSDSLLKLTGISLLDRMEGVENVHDVHTCIRYAVLSHDTQQDPIYIYFNQGAFLTFQWPDNEVYSLPSRYSAPGGELRNERDILMKKVVQDQVQTFSEAIRQTKSGHQFRLKDVLLWNVYDTGGNRVGQTALFDRTLIVPLETSIEQ